MNKKNSSAIYNIIDNHYKKPRSISKGKSEEQDLGIQVDNTSQDIFEQFDKKNIKGSKRKF